MGGAMLRGWLSARIANKIYTLDPQGLPPEFESYTEDTITHFKNAAQFSEAQPNTDVFVIALKPQIMDTACKSIASTIPESALVLSIAAGQTIAAFEKRFSETQPIIRAMPNTPAAIGKGITVAAASRHVTTEQKEQAEIILKSVGLVEWVDEESLLDPVTAVSGSGPAYIFLMIEAMAEAGEAAGLTPDFAMKLARQTVIGSAALAETESNTAASTLRENVTSPGGTTEAALKVLMNGKFQNILNKAIAAATARSKELSN